MVLKEILKEFEDIKIEDYSIRDKAKETYLKIVENIASVTNLKSIEKKYSGKSHKGSLLAKTILENKNFESYEHLFYLIHLLAFSSGMDWQRMWEEFMYIKNNINISSNDEAAKGLNRIKEYIVEMQEQYR